MRVAQICPRCGRPHWPAPGDVPKSRVDGTTPICARCAVDETMIAANSGFTRIHPRTGMKPWVNRAAADRALSMALHPSFRGAPE